MAKLLTLACLFLLSGTSVFGKVQNQAAPAIISVEAKRQDFSRLNPNVQPKDSLGINLKEVAPDENRIVIGIEKRRHVFLVAGNVRFDGRIVHDPQATVFNSELPAGQGIFAVLENVPAGMVNQLKQSLLEPANQVYFGCVHAAFSKLKEVGISSSVERGLVVETSQVFDALTNGPFVLSNNRSIQTRLYRTQDLDLEQFGIDLKRYDNKVRSDISRKFRGLNPHELVEKINGQSKPISRELKAYLSDLTGSGPTKSGSEIDEKLMDLLRKVTQSVPPNSVVTWSRAPFEIALQRKIAGREIGEGLVLLGYKPLDQYLPIPPVWSAAHNLECVLKFAKDTPDDVPLYSLTEVYKRKSGVLNLHGAELKVWEALGRKIVWGPEVGIESRNLSQIQNQYLEPAQVPMVKNRLGKVDAVRTVLPPGETLTASLPNSNVYWQLVSDIFEESSQWYRGQDIETARAELNRILTAKTPNIEGLKLLNDLWPPNEFSRQPVKTDLVAVDAPAVLLSQPHGMADLQTYLGRRLGPNLLALLRANKISVKVIASSDLILPDSGSYQEIPSIYARRGIRKFFSPETNTLVIKIPPLEEFAKHFAAMLKLAGGRNSGVWISPASQKQYQQNTNRDIANSWKKLGVSQPHVLLNGNPWIKMHLQSKDSTWEIVDSKTEVTIEFGVTLQAFKIRHKFLGITTTVVAVNSIQNRWGDGAAILADAFLRLGVKSITTSGFVGGPGIGKPNDISIPSRFFVNDKRVNITNFLNEEGIQKQARQDGLATSIHFNTNHAHSSSPAEQTQDFVMRFIHHGYQTVDVEQALIAETVAKFNLKSGKNVAFGSIGLITDVPRSSPENASGHVEDLDHVDPEARAKSIGVGAKLFEDGLLELELENRQQPDCAIRLVS